MKQHTCRLSRDLFFLRWSTAIPIVRAFLAEKPASCRCSTSLFSIAQDKLANLATDCTSGPVLKLPKFAAPK